MFRAVLVTALLAGSAANVSAQPGAQVPTPSEPKAEAMQKDSATLITFCTGLLIVTLAGFALVGVSMFTSKGSPPHPKDAEPDRIYFAAATLTGLGILFALAVGAQVWVGDAGKSAFDACKVALPPIVTLVIGYYFGRAGGRSNRDEPPAKDVAAAGA